MLLRRRSRFLFGRSYHHFYLLSHKWDADASCTQTMLKNLYEHFEVLYENILPANPTLASEHALRQEEEVYKKSTKTSYRHVRRFILLFV